MRHRLLKRYLVVVADCSFVVIERLTMRIALPKPIFRVLRFRLDAALDEPVQARYAGISGCSRKNGKRLPTLEHAAINPRTQWKTVSPITN